MIYRKYEISRPGDKCLMCGKALDTIPKHPSSLKVDSDDEILLRHDYCEECWEKMKEQPYFSHWYTRRVPKTTESERQQRLNARQRALKLFRETMDSDSENRSARLYILAHLLLRLRAFKWVGHETDSETTVRMLVFETSEPGEKIKIPHVRLSEEQLSEAQQFVDSILKGESVNVSQSAEESDEAYDGNDDENQPHDDGSDDVE